MNVGRTISIRPSNAGNQALNNERLTINRISELKNKYMPESNLCSVALRFTSNLVIQQNRMMGVLMADGICTVANYYNYQSRPIQDVQQNETNNQQTLGVDLIQICMVGLLNHFCKSSEDSPVNNLEYFFIFANILTGIYKLSVSFNAQTRQIENGNSNQENTESAEINSSNNNNSYSENTEPGEFNPSDNNRSDEHTGREESRSSNNNRFRENIDINFSSSDDESGEEDNERDTAKETNEKIINCKSLNDVLGILKTFQRNNVTLNENSYSIIIDKHTKDFKETKKLIKNMKRKEIPINEPLLKAIIKKYNNLTSISFLKTNAGNPLAGKLIHEVILKEFKTINGFARLLRVMRTQQINGNHDINKYIIDRCKTKDDVAELLKRLKAVIPDDNFYDECFNIDKKESNNVWEWVMALKSQQITNNPKIHSELHKQCKNDDERQFLEDHYPYSNENVEPVTKNQKNDTSVQEYVSDIAEAGSPGKAIQNRQELRLGALAESTQTGGQNADNHLAKVIVQSEINNNLANGVQLEEYLNAPNASQASLDDLLNATQNNGQIETLRQ